MINSELVRTVAHFEELPFADQAAVVWQRGQPLAVRQLPEFRLHLYSVGRFYVEMWVCKRRYIVTLLRAFSDTDGLMPYVENCLDINLLTALLPNTRKSDA